jgi:hypothetical protein
VRSVAWGARLKRGRVMVSAVTAGMASPLSSTIKISLAFNYPRAQVVERAVPG